MKHLYAEPVLKPGAALKAALQAPLAHRPPNLLPVDYEGLDLYQLFEDYKYMHKTGEREELKGRLVDGASVPQFAWSYCPPDGRHRRASFLHDLDYGLKLLPKSEADLEFRRNLLEDGVSAARVFIIYRAVKYFGDPRKSVARWSLPLYD